MADRLLIWYLPDFNANGPVYYMDSDYTPTRLTIYARIPPHIGNMEFDILDDSVSIMKDSVTLPEGQSLDEDAEYLKSGVIIKAGSLVSLLVSETNGAKDVTIQLELEKA